ncbi:hypothetical protein [Flavobacterium sp.]|uniref:hypothetical protein n=1 Tax=Flavobacterium sp. TaxID=239 RepID=UPI0037517829
MKTAKEKSKNLATPGKPMTQDQFSALIKEAENGEFMTEKEFNAKFDKWLMERKK